MKYGNLNTHILKLADAVNIWLRPDNMELKQAVDRTIEEQQFEPEDVKYQIRWLKKSLQESEFRRWAEKNEVVLTDKPKNVVCLHAGNLPLVGIQDLLSVILTGHNYIGKISRKDPYLLPSFLKVLAENQLVQQGSWATQINILPEIKADAVMFAGSDESVETVFNKLKELSIADSSTPALIRTAHFSIAHIEDFESSTMRMVTEAAFRYAGNGCRSVAMVVAPFSLASEVCHITDYAEEYLLKLSSPVKQNPLLHRRFAYNKAVGIKQVWLDRFLFEETSHEPSVPGLIHWVTGDRETTAELATRFSKSLQSVYVTDKSVQIEGVETELLQQAQKPPIDWKPDGTDSVAWLMGLF